LGSFELIVGIAIAIPASRSIGTLLGAILLLVYLVMMARQLLQGKKDLVCGCAGPASDAKISPALLLRNFALISLAMFCFASHLTTVHAGMQIGSALLLSLGLALGMVLLYLCLEQLISNQQKLQNLLR
ncbi:MAG: MauE/DoxX family redox-associated membrane protein, partial [Pseudomonadales bacterium]